MMKRLGWLCAFLVLVGLRSDSFAETSRLSVEAFVEGLKSEEVEIRKDALLRSIDLLDHHEIIIPRLIEFVPAEPDPVVASMALESLCTFPYPPDKSLLDDYPEVLNLLLASLHRKDEQDIYDLIRRCAASKLAGFGSDASDAFPSLQAILLNHDPSSGFENQYHAGFMSSVLYAIGRIGVSDDQTPEILLNYLSGYFPDVTTQAANTLNQLGSSMSSITPQVVELLETGKYASLRYRATLVLAGIAVGDPKAEEALIRALRDQDKLVSWYAAVALESVNPYLKVIFDSRDFSPDSFVERQQVIEKVKNDMKLRALFIQYLEAQLQAYLNDLDRGGSASHYVEFLSELNSVSSAPVLLDCFWKARDEQNDSFSLSCLDAVVKLGQRERVIPLLRELEQDPENAMNRVGAHAMLHLCALEDLREVHSLYERHAADRVLSIPFNRELFFQQLLPFKPGKQWTEAEWISELDANFENVMNALVFIETIRLRGGFSPSVEFEVLNPEVNESRSLSRLEVRAVGELSSQTYRVVPVGRHWVPVERIGTLNWSIANEFSPF